MAKGLDLGGINPEELGKLMELLTGSDVEECEIEQGEFKLSLRRTVRDGSVPERIVTTPLPAGDETREESLVIQAQTVGVFYRAERSATRPKVDVGAEIKSGDILGYIEVMMVPHNVYSTYEGIVESFLAEDGQPVEYGQPLVKLRPAGVA